MSAEKLHEAAKVLRGLAEAIEDTEGDGWSNLGRASSWDEFYCLPGVAASSIEGEYIAAMHPDVGLALADLLDSLAFDREVNGEIDGRTWDHDIVPLADLILGGAK